MQSNSNTTSEDVLQVEIKIRGSVLYTTSISYTRQPMENLGPSHNEESYALHEGSNARRITLILQKSDTTGFYMRGKLVIDII